MGDSRAAGLCARRCVATVDFPTKTTPDPMTGKQTSDVIFPSTRPHIRPPRAPLDADAGARVVTTCSRRPERARLFA